MARLESFIDSLTPALLKGDLNTRKRVRMFLLSHMFGPFLGLTIPLLLAFSDPHPMPHVLVLAISIAGFWPFLWLIQVFARHYFALSLISICNLNFAVLWGAYHYGGASSPFLVWYLLVPMLAFFYLGSTTRARVMVFVQILAGLGSFTAAFLLAGQQFPVHIGLNDMVSAGILSVFCSTTYAFIMASYYSSVVDSQSELIKEFDRHKGTLVQLTEAKDEADEANVALSRAKNHAEAKNIELEIAKARLEHNSLHDTLTGLPNRRYLDDVLAQHAIRCSRNGGSVALLHIDLDRFKQINDTLGHVAGDAMLVHVANLLQSMTDAEDFVARVGGDEFVLVCSSAKNTRDLANLAERVIDQIRQPVPYEGHLCRFGACVGIAIETGRGVDPKRLLVNSDIALYRAKARGRGRSEFFSEELQAQIIKSKRIADDILRGLEQNEFFAQYQPQFDARTFKIVGVEALVRWNHPTAGILTPPAFLKIADELNVVAVLDRIILEQALVDFDSWQNAGLNIPKVSVNVSSRRLNDRELIDSLRSLNIRPGTVTFELVESIFLDETEEIVSNNIEQIKALGIDIEIDDFGTGHASIVSLLKLDPFRFKIDRQFITSIATSSEKRKLIASIIEIGKSLDIGVVAEGVETMEQAHILKELGCDVLQGYAFARPMPASELGKFMRSHQWRQAS